MLTVFKKLSTHKMLWTITTVLVLITAAIGVMAPRIYDGLFPPEFIPGAWPQDVLSVVLCLSMLFLSRKIKENSIKLQIIGLGIIGSFFYLYGIFTIERVYNYYYLLYATIFSLSFWSIVYGLMSIKEEILKKLTLSAGISIISASFAFVIAVLFTFLWIAALLPLMREHNRIEYLYSIYIIDLCFIMPAFFITSVLTFRKKAIGLALLPAVYIIGFFVIFPLGLGEIAKLFYGQSANFGSMIISFLFSVLMLSVAALHLKKMKIS